jgi:Plavaka transposase
MSEANRFFLWRRYYGLHLPLHDAERNTSFEDPEESPPPESPSSTTQPIELGPFPNLSAFWFADWWWNSGNEKSSHELRKLLTLVNTQGFSLTDAFSTNWNATMMSFDADERSSSSSSDETSWFNDADWILTPVTIPVSFHRLMKNPGTRYQTVGNMRHRRLISVIEEKICNVEPGHFHYQPYELFWSPPTNDDTQFDFRVQGELYNSPAFVEAHQKLQNSPQIQGCNRERVVVALMIWSDETHLSSFGSAKLWPVYIFFGNESKYRRSKTSLRLCEHIAYLESVSRIPTAFGVGIEVG